ncbi:hypothetical protein Tco_0428952, partial [Tanacetum coccineum]
KWSLDTLSADQEMSGPYNTELLTPDEIKTHVWSERTVFTRTHRRVVVLPYGMLLTRLYHHVMGEYPHLTSPQYIFYDRVMLSLGAPTAHKPRDDIGVKHGHHSASTSSTFHHDSSSCHNDDDVDMAMHDDGTSHQSTPSPTTYYHSIFPIMPETFVDAPENDQNMSTMFTR